MKLAKLMKRVGLILLFAHWIPHLLSVVVMRVEMPRRIKAANEGRPYERMLPDHHKLSRAGFYGLYMVFGMYFGGEAVGAIARERIRRNGRSAKARILGVEETRTTIKSGSTRRRVIRLRLEVTPTDRSPFQAEIEKAVSYFEMGGFHPGRIVDVKYDPKSLSAVLA